VRRGITYNPFFAVARNGRCRWARRDEMEPILFAVFITVWDGGLGIRLPKVSGGADALLRGWR
jgi:hypothetical protein